MKTSLSFFSNSLYFIDLWYLIDVVLEKGTPQDVDLLLATILIVALLGGLGHHLPTVALELVSLEGTCLLQVLAILLLRETWRRNSQDLAG